MRDALVQWPGRPLEIEDETTHSVYVIVRKEDFRQLVDEELRRQLQIGFDQADAGEVIHWDVDAFRERMHRERRSRQP